MSSNVSMKDIASSLGIAASTVSRALKQDQRISAETRERVVEAARRLGYRPNPLVSTLMATRKRRGSVGEVGTIALITDYQGGRPWQEKDVCKWAYSGIVKRASDLGYSISLFDLKDYQHDFAKLEKTLIARGIRGVLLGFSRNENPNLSFSPKRFAIAGLSTYFRHMQVDRSNFYGFYNVRLALKKLGEYGYRRPGLVVPEFNNAVSDNAWSAAYLDWQRQLNSADRCPPYIPKKEAKVSDFKEWIESCQPDVLLVYKVPVRRYLGEMGIRVPEDIGLAYLYRNADEMGMTAGIDGRMHLVGAASLDLVIQRLQHNTIHENIDTKDVLVKGIWHHGPTLRFKGQKENTVEETP